MVYIEITETYEGSKLTRITKIIADESKQVPSSSAKISIKSWLWKSIKFLFIAILKILVVDQETISLH